MASDEEYYALFLNALAGLIDDAEMSGYHAEGIAHLREADEFFNSEYRILKPVREQDAARDGGGG